MPPTEATLGRLLLQDAVPHEVRHLAAGELAAPQLSALFQALAEARPDLYRQTAKKLTDIGARASSESGGYSFSMHHLRAPAELEAVRTAYKAHVRGLMSDPRLSEQNRNDRLIKAALEAMPRLEEVGMASALKEGNPLALQVQSKAKGKPTNLRSILAGDVLYTDSEHNPVPIPITRSFAEGLSPAEYFAGTFGARQALSSTKLGTADAGYFSKRLKNAAHRLVVTAEDEPDRDPDDARPRYARGLPVDLLDPANEGSLLAAPTGGYARNTVLTSDVIDDLKRKGRRDILIRSPLVGGPVDGGVYSRDAGVRERGGLAPVGDHVGMAAADALCLDADTEVRMADGGIRKIRDLAPGDRVLTASITGVVRPGLVLRRYDNGIKECYETVFRLGTGRSVDVNLLRMVSTLDHKILSTFVANKANDRHPLPSVRPVRRPDKSHDYMHAKLGTGYDDARHVTEPFAMGLGLLIGDGSYTGGSDGSGTGVMFSCYDDTLVEYATTYFRSIGCKLAYTGPGEYGIRDELGGKMRTGGRCTDVRNPVRAKLLGWGLWGQYSGDKCLPDDVLMWDNQSVAELLAGLWATDGWISPCNGVRVVAGYASNSLKLVSAVRDLLATRFGVYTSAPRANTKKRSDGTNYNPTYTLQISSYDSMTRFQASIRIPGVKGPRLRQYMLAWNKPKYKSHEAGRCALLSQTPVGLRETCDIEVDHPDHLFVLANGLIVSNSEPVSQTVIGSKHGGGVAGASKTQQGFPVIDRMVSIPERSPGSAVHAQTDGDVESVEPAPQGGTYVTVAGERHYVPSDRDVGVARGDTVEAGDVLTDGTPRPEQYVAHKGLGEGRKRFVEAFGKVLRDSGLKPDRRNLELLSRGLIDHVRIDEELGDYAPGDVVPYSALEPGYEPRPGHERLAPKAALGKYLESPVLHHTIGTKVKKSMLAEFAKYGVDELAVHDRPPVFTPVMIRSQETINHDRDWITRQLGTGLEKHLLKGLHRGDVADPQGTSFAPALAEGVHFGVLGKTKGWVPPVEPIPLRIPGRAS